MAMPSGGTFSMTSSAVGKGSAEARNVYLLISKCLGVDWEASMCAGMVCAVE